VVLVDTNILAYLLIEGNRTPEAQALYGRDPDWRSEAFIMVEFSNILATYVRAGRITHKQALDQLAAAQGLIPTPTTVQHSHSLEIAIEFGLSVYDARFIAAATQLRVKLMTEDAKLREAVPAWTQALVEVTS